MTTAQKIAQDQRNRRNARRRYLALIRRADLDRKRAHQARDFCRHMGNVKTAGGFRLRCTGHFQDLVAALDRKNPFFYSLPGS